jgi:hypothetical protein
LQNFYSPSRLGMLSTATFGLSQFLVIALSPAIADASQLHISEVIMAFALGTLIFLWGSPFWAQKSDVYGREKILAIGLFGLGISSLLLTSIVQIPLTPLIAESTLILSRIVYGVFASAIASVVQAWWRDQKGSVSQNMISHSLGLNLGRFLAPVLVLGFQGELIWILGVLSALSLGLSMVALAAKDKTVLFAQNEKSQRSNFSYPILLAFMTTTFIGLVHATLAPYIKLNLNLGTHETSLLAAQALLISSAVTLGTQLLLKRVKSLKGAALLWTGIPLWFIFSLLFSQFKMLSELWIAMALVSVGIALIIPGYLSFVQTGGKSAGLVNSSQTLGLAFGSALGALLLQDAQWLGLALIALTLLLGFTTTKLKPAPRCAAC